MSSTNQELRQEPLTKEDLEVLAARGCDIPGCDCRNEEIFVHPRCHNDGLYVSYNPKSGLVHLTCRRCEAPVLNIVPASRQESPKVQLDKERPHGAC